MPFRPHIAPTPWSYQLRYPSHLGAHTGNYTMGMYFHVMAVGSFVRGVRFRFPITAGVERTVRCSFWDPGVDTPETTVDVVIPASSPGIYDGYFPNGGVEITEERFLLQCLGSQIWDRHFCVSIWETSGTHYWEFYNGNHQVNYTTREYGIITEAGAADVYQTAGSNVKPKNGTSWVIGIDPIVEVYADRSDTDPPFLLNVSPVADSTQNSRSGSISMDIVDAWAGVDKFSIDVRVNYIIAYEGATETFFSPFDGVGSSLTETTYDAYDGYRLVLDRTSDFSSFETIDMHVHSADLLDNYMDSYYSFRIEDYEAPIAMNLYPLPGSTNIAEDTLISFDAYDVGSGLDFSTLQITVNGVDAYNASGFISPFDGPSSGITPTLIDGYDAYHIVIDATYDYKSEGTVNVVVNLNDNEGN